MGVVAFGVIVSPCDTPDRSGTPSTLLGVTNQNDPTITRPTATASASDTAKTRKFNRFGDPCRTSDVDMPGSVGRICDGFFMSKLLYCKLTKSTAG